MSKSELLASTAPLMVPVLGPEELEESPEIAGTTRDVPASGKEPTPTTKRAVPPPERPVPPPNGRLDFWYSAIREADASDFLNLSVNTLRAYRSRGGGPRYIAVSSRCIRYRRIDCRKWLEQRLRTSTSDPGDHDEQTRSAGRR